MATMAMKKQKQEDLRLMVSVVVPVKAVFKIPVMVPCVTVAPALAIIGCELTVKVHSLLCTRVAVPA